MRLQKPLVADFLNLFKGNQASHGVHYPEKTVKEGEKAPGKSLVVHEEVTEELVLKHLHGKQGLGIIPIDHSNQVNFAVIDIDEYPSNPNKHMKILQKAGIPHVMFRSKSGGLHLFMFFSDAPEASKIRPALLKMLMMLGLPNDTEVFPKQTMLQEGTTGNWINLPYFDHNNTARYAYDSKAKKINLEDAILRIKGVRQPYKQFLAAIDNAPLAKAPPCLQTIFLSGGLEPNAGRNTYLFNCACYLKARYKEDYEQYLHDLNKKTDHPIDYAELNRTAISSHNKNNYTYACKEPILVEYCNKEECSTREFGVTSGSVSSLNFGQLTIYNASEPYYEWEINGKILRFDDAKSLENQATFRTLCLKELYLPQHRMKDAKWIEILKTAMDNIVEKEASKDEISEDNLWIHKVTQFFKENQTTTIAEVHDGKVFCSDDEILFKSMALAEHLSETRAFMSFSTKRHNNLIKNTLGGDFQNVSRKGFKGRAVVVNAKLLKAKGILVEFRNKKAHLRKVQSEGKDPIQYLDEHKAKF